MTYTPFAHAESLRIATVDFVSPDEVKALLDIEAPESVALNAGGARPFPRVNGYVLMPVDGSYLVGQIEWITIERSAFPKRRGVQDFGLIDLPYPLRRMRLNPLGTLSKSAGTEDAFRFRRGADLLPAIGTAVLLPTDAQLRSIVESGERRFVRIGASPLAANAVVSVDPDRVFGRHLAVLGNTGSGKSCSVAGLIRWSLDAAAESRSVEHAPNARFIVLDPNGEYARAFSEDGDRLRAKVFKVGGGAGENALQVPLWLWNSSEWASFAQASAKTQRPLLKRALREVRSGRGAVTAEEDRRTKARRSMSSALLAFRADRQAGAPASKATRFGTTLKRIRDDVQYHGEQLESEQFAKVVVTIDAALVDAGYTWQKGGAVIESFHRFQERHLDCIEAAMSTVVAAFGHSGCQEGPDEDMPLPFDGNELADHLELLAEQDGVSQWVDLFVSRIRTLLSDARIRSVIADTEALSLEQWLVEYVGGAGAAQPHLVILDLSLVPTEVAHVVTAVVARMVFEALQRYRRLEGAVLPTVLVMEEAHTFVKRYKEDLDNQDAASLCCQVFERIAREGRKFGLGLVLSSQRPYELSPTVLSQCNTFLLHRISNDKDQELVRRLLPDSLQGLLRELPSLPSQHAILLGWASELPVLLKVDDLPQHQRPHSADPDFWSVWTGRKPDGSIEERQVDWRRVADEWQGNADTATREIAVD